MLNVTGEKNLIQKMLKVEKFKSGWIDTLILAFQVSYL